MKHVLREVGSGGTPDTKNDAFWSDGNGTPWVAIGDMSNRDHIHETEKHVSNAGLDDKGLEVWPVGTLLFSMYASLGHVAVLRIAATTNQAMLACAGCALQSPFILVTAGIFGGWAPLVFVLLPYRLKSRLERLWGLPRFRLSDFISLSLLFIWPLTIARIGRDDHSLTWIMTCFSFLAICIGFLWIRGLWILQQLDVSSFFKRTLFLGILLPGMVVFAFVVGCWMYTALAFLSWGAIEGLIVGRGGYLVVRGDSVRAPALGDELCDWSASASSIKTKRSGARQPVVPRIAVRRGRQHRGVPTPLFPISVQPQV